MARSKTSKLQVCASLPLDMEKQDTEKINRRQHEDEVIMEEHKNIPLRKKSHE